MSEIREMRKALADVTASFERFGDALITYATDRTMWQIERYGECQAHYGTRRVTARQYRAWKRQVGRR